MSSQQDPTNKKKEDNKEQKDAKLSQKADTPKKTKSKSTSTPKDNKKNSIAIPNDKDNDKDIGVPFSQIYDYHIKLIEEKTNLKINQIYWFLFISFIFFTIGRFELIFSYIITLYFPIKWTKEDYLEKKRNFGKKWGMYWTVFIVLIFFDLHKKIVLKIIPLYFLIKCIILLMLYLPGFNLAEYIYDSLLRNIFQEIEEQFQNRDEHDTMVNDLKKKVKVKTE
jgi:receptor expression-enhancing protein 5/6